MYINGNLFHREDTNFQSRLGYCCAYLADNKNKIWFEELRYYQWAQCYVMLRTARYALHINDITNVKLRSDFQCKYVTTKWVHSTATSQESTASIY